MTGEPPVDVVIPTYQRPDFIAEAIESVLAQTLDSWRLLVHDNGPGGGVIATAVEPYLRDPRIEYRATGSEVEATENWTRAIQAGSAPYVGMLHDDDLWEPGFLERRVSLLEAHPECGFAFSANVEVDQTGRRLGEIPYVLPEGVYSPREFMPVLYRHNVIGPPTILVRRSAYEAVGPFFDPTYYPPFDYEMWVRIAARFSVGYLRVRDCVSRTHDTRLTYELKHREAMLRLLDHAEELIREHVPGLELDSRMRRRRRSAALLTAGLDALDAGDRRGCLSYLRQAIRMYPRSLLDVRFWGGLGALALGAPGRRLLGRARYVVRRRGIKLHYR